jgi:electron transfer flavoprotein alpha subunit
MSGTRAGGRRSSTPNTWPCAIAPAWWISRPSRSSTSPAGLLDGAVGCSRAVTSQGWRPHADQIGQTGARLAPELYIACGVSGAIQHMVGCKGARHILAINSDPEASIIAHADYAIIGDLHQIIPALCAEIRKVKGP